MGTWPNSGNDVEGKSGHGENECLFYELLCVGLSLMILWPTNYLSEDKRDTRRRIRAITSALSQN